MVNEDKTQVAIGALAWVYDSFIRLQFDRGGFLLSDLTEHMDSRFYQHPSLRFGLRVYVFLDLVKENDGKYRIWRYA